MLCFLKIWDRIERNGIEWLNRDRVHTVTLGICGETKNGKFGKIRKILGKVWQEKKKKKKVNLELSLHELKTIHKYQTSLKMKHQAKIHKYDILLMPLTIFWICKF